MDWKRWRATGVRWLLYGSLGLLSGMAVFAAFTVGWAQEDLRVALRRQAEQFSARGYELSGTEVVDAIARGQSKSYPVQLVTGVGNAVVVVCGTNCDHVEMTLYDYQHKLLTRIAEKQSIAILNGNPTYSGLHEIEITAPGCQAERCDIGLLAMRQKPIEPQPPLIAPPPSVATTSTERSEEEIVKALQRELKRVGCDPGEIDGQWGENTQRALSEFAKRTAPHLQTDRPSEAAVSLVSAQVAAACGNAPAADSPGRFNGTWVIQWRGSGDKPCRLPDGRFHGAYTITIQNEVIGDGVFVGEIPPAKAVTGRVLPNGSARWRTYARTDGAPIRTEGTFRGATGAGRVARLDGRCTATFNARKT